MSWAHRIEHHGMVQSTMDEARRAANAGAAHGTSVHARGQAAARGRHGRRWFAPMDAGVYVTTLLRPRAQAGVERLSLVAGAAVHDALWALGASVQLKWPNDVVTGPRKLAGILLEADDLASASPRVFVGVGVNLAPAASVPWPSDMRSPAVGLADLLEQTPSSRAVAAALVASLEAHYAGWEAHGLRMALDVWRDADVLRGHTVRVESSDMPLVGEAAGVADDGQLLVRGGDGLVRVGAGEVTRVRPALS